MKPKYRTVMEFSIPYAKKKKILQVNLEKGRVDGQKEYRLHLRSSRISTHPSLRRKERILTWNRYVPIWKCYRREKISSFIYSHR